MCGNFFFFFIIPFWPDGYVIILWWLITVPGDPQDVRATSINSTAIRVQWRPPLEKDRNGIIRGYHIHVQETKEEVCNDAWVATCNVQFLYSVVERWYHNMNQKSASLKDRSLLYFVWPFFFYN